MRNVPAVVALVFTLTAAPASAQVARLQVESAAAIDFFGGDNVSNRPQIIIDLSATVRLDDRWQLLVRPRFRLPRPASATGTVPPWDRELFQGGVRYERPGDVALRLDAGFIVSPIGIGPQDARPDLNPVINYHPAYAIPMPAFEPTAPLEVPVAVTYPLGTVVTLSSQRWDARAAVVNSSPTRRFAAGNRSKNPRHTPVVVAGAGVTPHIGLRFGAAFAHGEYATASERTLAGADGLSMTMAAGEAEYSVAYTRINGEIVRTSFDTRLQPAIAYEWFVQARQTLTPRWFLAARHEGASAPPLLSGALPDAAAVRAGLRTTLRTVEATAGFRATPHVTLRGSVYTRRIYTRTTWDRQFAVSAVWAQRWSR